MGGDLFLLLPVGSAVLYVVAALFIKRAIELGAGDRQVNVVANVAAAVIFQPVWLLAGEVAWDLVWMPLVAAGLFFLGQIFTFRALRHGDVSVATPLLGMKVLLVAVVSSVFFREVLELRWWMGAVASSLGVVLVTGATWRTLAPRLLQVDAVMALAAAAAFAVTDVLVQQWAPRFGIGGFLPLMFVVVAVLSVAVAAPRGGWGIFVVRREAAAVLVIGGVVLGIQALGMAVALANSGNATAVNIVYSSRAIWSVVLAWLLGRYFDVHGRSVSGAVMRGRLAGSILLFVAVVLVLI